MKRTPTTTVAIAAFLTALLCLPAVAREPSNEGRLTGEAACYSRRLIGHRTTSGQRYDPKALTAAHGTIPQSTRVKVTNLENGKSVVVVINDHMSSRGKIIMDISQRACDELAFGPGGEAKVKLEVEPSNSAESH
jgi:peptidoglycan lytic transglycosylase